MPAIISTAHQKGGVGKTTLILNIYGHLKANGFKCAVVDADPQGSISYLCDRLKHKDGWKAVELIKRESFSNFSDLVGLEQYDVLLIDTPPYLSNIMPQIFQISDFVLIPCKASPLDAIAIENTLEFIKQGLVKNPNLKAGIVMNMTIAGTGFNKEVRAILEQHDFPVLETEIGNRIAYSRSLLLSPSVAVEKNAKAKKEIDLLITEIFKIIKS